MLLTAKTKEMSKLSGFPTEVLESKYHRSLAHLLQLMQTHLLQLLPQIPPSHTWAATFAETYRSLQELERHKQVQPHFSVYCGELADYLSLQVSSLSKQFTPESTRRPLIAPFMHLHTIAEKPVRHQSTPKLRPPVLPRAGSDKRLRTTTPKVQLQGPGEQWRRRRPLRKKPEPLGSF